MLLHVHPLHMYVFESWYSISNLWHWKNKKALRWFIHIFYLDCRFLHVPPKLPWSRIEFCMSQGYEPWYKSSEQSVLKTYLSLCTGSLNIICNLILFALHKSSEPHFFLAHGPYQPHASCQLKQFPLWTACGACFMKMPWFLRNHLWDRYLLKSPQILMDTQILVCNSILDQFYHTTEMN